MNTKKTYRIRYLLSEVTTEFELPSLSPQTIDARLDAVADESFDNKRIESILAKFEAKRHKSAMIPVRTRQTGETPCRTYQASKDATLASDVYSIAVVLVEIAAGIRVPIRIEEWSARAWKGFQKLLCSRLDRLYGADLSAVLVKALSPDKNDRYATAGEFAARLLDVLDGAPIPERFDPARSVLRLVRSKPGRVLGVAALLVAFLFGLYARDRSQAVSRIEGVFQSVSPLLAAEAWEEAEKLLVQAQPILERVPDRIDLARRCDELAYAIEFGKAATKKAQALAENDRTIEEMLRSARMAPAVSYRAGYNYAAGDRKYETVFATYLGQDLLKASRPQDVVAPLVTSPLRKQLAAGLAEWMVVHMKAALTSGSDRAIIRATSECQILREAALRLGNSGNEWEQRFYRAFGSPLAAFELRRLARDTDFQKTPPSQLTLLGEILIDQNLDEAIRFLREAQDVHPQDLWINYYLTSALLSRAEELNKQGEGEEMKKLLQLAHRSAERAEVLTSADPTLRTLLGAVLAETDQFPEAIDQWRRVLKRWPEAIHARANLVRALIQAGDLKGAQQAIDNAPEKSRQEPLYRLSLADWHLASGNPLEALRCYREILKPGSGFDAWGYHLNFARALLQTGDINGAKSALYIARLKWPDEARELLKQCAEREAARSSRAGSGDR